ncbi:MAG TPA: protein-disulfide reductase DsbD family protein [Ferruginibacter sp.]|nr:protein-disulfide reductase DsbD family protein [Ferruginibacter sp.]HRE62705.1 protein-disulfide reductase DsbD family protein [Ferruginibacter sp.]
MIKKITLSFLVSLFTLGIAFAQIENPVKWSYTAKKISDKEYDVYITASIDPKWHLYAQDAGEGPEPTTISFTKNPLVTNVGKTKEQGKLEKEYDNNFNSVLKFYSTKVSFVQRVKLKANVATVIKGSVSFMVCNDKKCLPPKSIPFSVNVGGKS